MPALSRLNLLFNSVLVLVASLLLVGCSPEFREARPEVPWKLLAGTRDKLIHFYEGVDLEEVWKMLTSDLPDLILRIEPLAPRGENPRDG